MAVLDPPPTRPFQTARRVRLVAAALGGALALFAIMFAIGARQMVTPLPGLVAVITVAVLVAAGAHWRVAAGERSMRAPKPAPEPPAVPPAQMLLGGPDCGELPPAPPLVPTLPPAVEVPGPRPAAPTEVIVPSLDEIFDV